jgi:hypothetical protein
MTSTARSIFVFGCYVIGLGLMMLLIPNRLLGFFGQPPTTEVWIRCAGMLLLLLGAYYLLAARAGLEPFFLWTVWGRSFVIVFFAAFVALGMAPPIFLAFGLVDLAGAAWTWRCIKTKPRNAP